MSAVATGSVAASAGGDIAWLWPLAVALAVTLLAAPVVRRIAVERQLYDHPDKGLKPHEQPVPYLGGVAIYIGWLGALLCAMVLWEECRDKLPWIAAAGSVLMLTGLVDDIRHLRPKVRLLVQGGVAGLLLLGGIGEDALLACMLPFRDFLPEWMLSEVVTTVLGGLFCVVVLAGATNSTNLIDGLDGLCAGIVAIASAGFFIIAESVGPAGAAGGGEKLILTAVCLGVLGACVGFLRHNHNPASMFMGDSGSYLLGFNVAVVLIILAEQPSWRWFAGGLMIFAFPVFDTALAIVRRCLNDRPLFIGDRSHFYDQLRDRGLSVRQTVLLCYGIGLCFAVVGAVAVRLSASALVGVFAVGPILLALCCWRLGMLRVDDAAERSNKNTNEPR
ncbi:MAG: MraY family glycosyltransferase [Planctomycetota bacterium]